MSGTVKLRFVPQAWVNDYAIEVDPEGPTEWEVPAGLVDFDFDRDHWRRDALKNHHNAPDWVRGWQGPFEVELADFPCVEDALKAAGIRSLVPHSIWAVWSEDGTEVMAFELEKEEAARYIEDRYQHKFHLAEYTLKTSELVGGDT